MTLVERKRFELKQKLNSLQLEFEMWRSESGKAGPLEKHHSQIKRITDLLLGHCEITQKKLNGLTGNAEKLLEESKNLERQMLELHRIWEFFRSKFAMRSVAWFNSYLVAADEFAWRCYHAAQSRANPQCIAPSSIKEPPLVFFNGGLSPFSMPRKFEFQAEDVPDEEITTKKFFKLLADLPIPLIGIPWFQIQYLPDGLAISHEVGHIVRDDFRLEARTKALLEQGMEDRGVPKRHRTAWRKWLDEIFADIYGTLATGPAFVASLIDFVAMGKDAIIKERATGRNWGSYPTVYLRVLLTLEVLRRQEFMAEAEQLKNTWEATFESHAMPEYVEDIKAVVESLVVGPYPEFGNVALTDVISFSLPNQINAKQVAESLLNGGPIDNASDVRELYAASRWAFAKDPGKYETRNIQTKILNSILENRESGVRRESLTPRNVDDKKAGEELFEKLQTLLKYQ